MPASWEKATSFRLAGLAGSSFRSSFFPEIGRSVPGGMVVVVGRSVVVVVWVVLVVVVGSVQGPKSPIMPGMPDTPLLVGVGQARPKSAALSFVFLERERLCVPSPGAEVVGVPAVGPPM